MKKILFTILFLALIIELKSQINVIPQEYYSSINTLLTPQPHRMITINPILGDDIINDNFHYPPSGLSKKSYITSISPSQDEIGVSKNTQVIVELNTPIDSFDFQLNSLFQIYGSSSGLIKGTIEIYSNENKFIFRPEKSFFTGEVVNASFGPLIAPQDSSKISFQWRFTIEITNPTNANFDSLRRFDYPSFNAIANDFDNDGDIDIVSATGIVIYNNGSGEFNSYQEIEELVGLKYLLDVNNDQVMDVITSSAESANVLLGDSLGNYKLYQNIYSVGGLIIAKGDINGDSFVDLIAKDSWGEGGQNFLWKKLLNNGTGKFIEDTITTYLENYIAEADLVDMDKDGDLDLVLLNTWPSDPSTQFDGAYIYYNDGLGSFVDSTITRFYLCPYNLPLSDLRQLFVIDYNSDGLNDIAGFGSQTGGLIIFQDSNTFCGYVETAFGGAENFAFFTSGDINGDDRFDIVISNLQVCKECSDGEVTMETYLNFDPINFWSDSAVTWYPLGVRSEVGVAVVPVLADVDNDGDLDVIHTDYPTTVTYNENVVTGVKETSKFPLLFSLSQNYPNPFNSTTKISYTLPSSGHVKLTVYNALGEVVEILFEGEKSFGQYLQVWNAASQPSGVYFAMLKVNDQIKTIQLICLK